VTDKRGIVLEEKINLIERKMAILTRRVEELAACLREFEDLRFEIAGLKLFLGRAYPAFKSESQGSSRRFQERPASSRRSSRTSRTSLVKEFESRLTRKTILC
jgi:hypothetical protein